MRDESGGMAVLRCVKLAQMHIVTVGAVWLARRGGCSELATRTRGKGYGRCGTDASTRTCTMPQVTLARGKDACQHVQAHWQCTGTHSHILLHM